MELQKQSEQNVIALQEKMNTRLKNLKIGQ